jgi:hypothetical protein
MFYVLVNSIEGVIFPFNWSPVHNSVTGQYLILYFPSIFDYITDFQIYSVEQAREMIGGWPDVS